MTPERFKKLRSCLDRRQPDLTVFAEDVHKSHNIAAILRTADAVGVLDMHAVSPQGDVERHHMVSGGSRKWVRMHVHPSLGDGLAKLRKDGFTIVAAHPADGHHASVDYREYDYTRPTALLLGSELDGITGEALAAADALVEIPMEGLVASLNVSVAAALILYEARRQRETAGLYERSRLPSASYETTLFEWAYPDLAIRCRDKSVPYPPLSDEGDLLQNPLA